MAQELARRAFVRSALTGTPANVVSSFAHAATWTSDTALLILDFQLGIGDPATREACCATGCCRAEAGRAGGLLLVFSTMQFHLGG